MTSRKQTAGNDRFIAARFSEFLYWCCRELEVASKESNCDLSSDIGAVVFWAPLARDLFHAVESLKQACDSTNESFIDGVVTISAAQQLLISRRMTPASEMVYSWRNYDKICTAHKQINAVRKAKRQKNSERKCEPLQEKQ